MKFYSPTHEPVHIALLSGHTSLVTKDGTDLAKMFYAEAINRGCSTEPYEAEEQEESDEEPDGVIVNGLVMDRKAVIKDAINDMLNGTNEDDFKADGTPNLLRLSAKVGFKVAKAEMTEAFAELSA